MSDLQPPMGPRKRKESSRVTENADPLLPRNKKPKSAPKPTTRKPNSNAKGNSGARRLKGLRTQIPPTRHSSFDPDVVDEPVLSSSPKSSRDVRESRGNAEEEDAANDNAKFDDAAHNNAEVDGVTDERQFIYVDDGDDDDETPEESANDELRAFTTDSA
jgi:hypothetical protein